MGDANAQVMCGYMAQNGIGTKENPQEAAKWYSLAADRGRMEVRIYLSQLYDEFHIPELRKWKIIEMCIRDRSITLILSHSKEAGMSNLI